MVRAVVEGRNATGKQTTMLARNGYLSVTSRCFIKTDGRTELVFGTDAGLLYYTML